MAYSIGDVVRHNGSQASPAPRHKISPTVIARALGFEGKPKWSFRDGLYRIGGVGFPPSILDLPIDEAIALAKRCCAPSQP